MATVLIVTTAFETYSVGDEITDPGTIATILSGPYSGDVVAINGGGGGGGTETLTLAVTNSVTGSAISLSGSVSNASPTALDYSIDGGNTWSAVTSYVLTGNNWTGKGPTYSTAQSGTIVVRDHNSTNIQSSSVNFTVTAAAGGGGGSGNGTLTLGDGSIISSIGAGLTAPTGTAGALAANFGTVTGTVADGGVVAAISASVGAEGGIAPLDAGKLVPVVNVPPIGKQVWAPQAGSATVFSKGPVPTPLNTISTMTLSDKFNVLGVFNFGEVWATQATYDATTELQNFLLYCQLMALAMKNTSLENVFYRICVDCYLPRGNYFISSPLIIPEYVRLTGPGMLIRTPYVGAQSGSNLVQGPFYATSATQEGLYLPTVVFPPRSHAERLHIYVNGNSGSYFFRGSGVAIGRFWCWQYESAVTIGSAGSGYSVGDLIYSAAPEQSPYQGGYIQVTAVNGGGGVTAATVYEGDVLDNGSQGCGAFGLPPNLQIQQWTSANGFSGVFDPSYPGYFLAARTTKGNGSTAGSGTGCSWLPTWCGDFGGGNYNFGGWGLFGGISASQRSALQADTIIEHINITGGVHPAYSATYGNSFNVNITGLNGIIGEIEVLTGNAGVNCIFANDWRFGHVNCVESATGIFLYSCGSMEFPNVVLDTCGCATFMSVCSRILMRGMVFFEQANLGAPVFPDSQNNAVVIGAASDSAYPNLHLDIDLTLVNMGGIPQTTLNAFPSLVSNGNVVEVMTASVSLAYIKSSRLKFNVSNWDESGQFYSYLPTLGFVTFGTGVDSSVTIEGVIDQITGPACIGNVSTTACGIRIWDSAYGSWPGGWAREYGTYEIKAPGAPTSGTSGTGAGKAGPGSTYMNVTNGTLYRQTGTLASPTWTTP
jgi:hypothetical protein